MVAQTGLVARKQLRKEITTARENEVPGAQRGKGGNEGAKARKLLEGLRRMEIEHFPGRWQVGRSQLWVQEEGAEPLGKPSYRGPQEVLMGVGRAVAGSL